MKTLIAILFFLPVCAHCQTYTTKDLSTKMRAAESNLAAQLKRIVSLESKNTTLQKQVNDLQSIIVKEIIDRSKAEAVIVQKIDSVTYILDTTKIITRGKMLTLKP